MWHIGKGDVCRLLQYLEIASVVTWHLNCTVSVKEFLICMGCYYWTMMVLVKTNGDFEPIKSYYFCLQVLNLHVLLVRKACLALFALYTVWNQKGEFRCSPGSLMRDPGNEVGAVSGPKFSVCHSQPCSPLWVMSHNKRLRGGSRIFRRRGCTSKEWRHWPVR